MLIKQIVFNHPVAMDRLWCINASNLMTCVFLPSIVFYLMNESIGVMEAEVFILFRLLMNGVWTQEHKIQDLVSGHLKVNNHMWQFLCNNDILRQKSVVCELQLNSQFWYCLRYENICCKHNLKWTYRWQVFINGVQQNTFYKLMNYAHNFLMKIIST